MMKQLFVCSILLVATFPRQVHAGTVDFRFSGPGVSGTVQLTYGPATDAKYSQAFEVTAISGTFSDTNSGLSLVNVPIGPLEPIKRDKPEPTNLLAPNDFSRFAVAAGLPPQSHGFISYSNLYWPSGSPKTASDYPLHGGFLDIYGLLFDIGGGMAVNLWSNGDLSGTAPIDYGVAVVTQNNALDYVSNGVSIVPEPSGFILLGIGLAGLLASRRDRLGAGFKS